MIDDVNPYLIKMLGYSREEFVKKKLWEVGARFAEHLPQIRHNKFGCHKAFPCRIWGGRVGADLLLSVINVSVQTVELVGQLPKIKFE
jgi:PAS domain-containing protein